MKPITKPGKRVDPFRASELAIIHVAKKQCNVTDDEYRIILKAQGGKESSSDMTRAERQAVIKYFKDQLGFKVAANPAHKKPSAAPAREDLVGKIGAQLTVLKKSWAYADGIAKKMFKVEKVQWCDPKQLRSIVAALAFKIKKQESANAKP